MRRRSTQTDHIERIRRVQAFMEAHLDDELALDALARIAALSLHHFHRVFRGVVGESVEAHVRRLRLERAARRLRARQPRIVQVAREAGYRSHEAFSRAFLEHFGQTPSQYRTQPVARAAASVACEDVWLPDVRLVRYSAIPVLALRHVGHWERAGRTFRMLVRWAAERRIQGRLHCLVPDDPDITPADQLRLDVCIECEHGAPPLAGMTTTFIPAGMYAVTQHRGAWSGLSETYDALIGRWLPATQHEPTLDPIVESYIDGTNVPEAERRTEIRIRIAEDADLERRTH